MPTCCSSSSAAVTSTTARSSPPTGPSPNGARSFQTPPASSPWSTAWSTTRRSSPSRANPIASRRLRNEPSSAHANDAKPSHEQSLECAAAHHPPQHSGLLDTGAELLDDLRDLIWAHYGLQLLDQYREQYGPADRD